MSKINKKQFMDSKNKQEVTKLKLRFGNVEILALNEKRIDKFLVLLNEMNTKGYIETDSKGISTTKWILEDLVELFHIMTNLGELSKEEVEDVLTSPSDDVLECQNYLINEYYVYVIETLNKTITTVQELSDEQAKEVIENGNNKGKITLEEFNKGREAIKKATEIVELKRKREELDKQIKEMEE